MEDQTCANIVDIAKQDPKIKQLLASLNTTESPLITCRKCNHNGIEGNSRAIILDSKPLEIVLCSNRLTTSDDISEVLTHELIHAYDYSLQRVDFNSCQGLAYSEVRAAREAECRDEISLLGFKTRCIRSKAKRSTHNLFPNAAGKCVDEVFAAAVNDFTPFSDKE